MTVQHAAQGLLVVGAGGGAGLGLQEQNCISTHVWEQTQIQAECPAWTASCCIQDHGISLMGLSLPGGATMGIIVIVAIACLAIVLASVLIRAVMVRCSD